MYQYADKGKAQPEKTKEHTLVANINSVQAETKMPVQTKSLFSFLRAPESGENQNAEQRLPKPAHAQPNNTGIPTQMKERFENLSGFSFDDVKVHYNSSKPAQLQALAYTQGNQVHIAPGQEKHLGHELGHVVQQKQGIVSSTASIKGISMNNSLKLEKEADKISLETMSANIPIKSEYMNNVIQCYAEVQSDAQGTNAMLAAGADPVAFANWNASVLGGIPALKNGLQLVYNLMRQQGTGIGPGSCNAIAEYRSPISGLLYHAIGNSFGQQATVHAERQAVQNVLGFAAAIDSAMADGNIPAHPANICRIYVELSPCPVCHDMLQAIVPNATVMYDFDYHTEVDKWKTVKTTESRKPSDGRFEKIPHESKGSSWIDTFMHPTLT